MNWVLVDISYLAYRALHSVGDLSHEDVPTGVMFGFFTQLRQLCLHPRIMSNRVLIFCDSRRSYRREAYPDYKRKRVQDRDEDMIRRVSLMRDQMFLLRRKVLPAVGFPVYRQNGVESDDLMALAAEELSTRRERGVMVTGDGDLFQCITKHVSWFDPARDAYHTPASIEFTKGIPAHRWGEVKTLAGCHSDNVRGVPGVGEQTAVQFLTGTLPARYARAQAIISPEGQRVAKRNRKLVVLPHAKTRPITLREPDYQPREFFRFCKRYGLASFLQERAAWEAWFKGSRFKVRRPGERG